MRYYLIAGEASGDLHGSNLVKGLLERDSVVVDAVPDRAERPHGDTPVWRDGFDISAESINMNACKGNCRKRGFEMFAVECHK